MTIYIDTLFSFTMWTKSEIINTELLFIPMHNMNFQKLIGGGGDKEVSPSAPNTLRLALSIIFCFLAAI
jgi:hypothetical protein